MNEVSNQGGKGRRMDGWAEGQMSDIIKPGFSSQGYGFPVVMYGCESWTIKKAEH